MTVDESTADAANGRRLTLVVAPASDHPAGLDLEGLVRFLSGRLGIPIALRHCRDYEEAITALKEGGADVGWLGPFAYLEASRDGAIEPLAIGVPKGKDTPNYQSLFLVGANSPIRALAQVKNHRIAISDRHSTSGYVVPKGELAEVGIDLDNASHFREIVRVPNHDEAIRAVVCGRVDVAAVSSVNFDENVRNRTLDGARVRILHRSPEISGAPLVCSRRLDRETRDLLKSLVLQAHHYVDIGGYGGAMERYLDPAEGRRRLLESYLRPQWGWRTHLATMATLFAIAAVMVDLDVRPWEVLQSASAYVGDFLQRAWPPDFSDFWSLARAMVETVEIAFLGTLLAIVVSIPVGLCSARNVAPNVVLYLVARAVTVFFRAVPEFIMAMVLVIAIGFGAMPGVIALGLHTMGFLAKFYAENIEHVNVEPIEALESLGANRLQILAFAVVPQILPAFVGNNLYILDRNVRMATMLGIVGAGGIGYELLSAFRMFAYPRVAAIIIVIFVTIYAIDMLSSYIRKRIQ